MLGTGARLSEALYLDWADLDLAKRRVLFTDTKNGEARGVPLNDRVLIGLSAFNRREGAAFLTPAGEPYERRIGGGGQLSTAWRGACKRAGFTEPVKAKRKVKGKIKTVTLHKPTISPHTLRHTWASCSMGRPMI